jgi:hypothetical protein
MSNEGFAYAYPITDGCGDVLSYGLTKRELFAAMAMQGLIADHENNAPHDVFAEVSVEMADALLKELEK